ncbi:AAA family ATPase [Variovorax paradoxus]|uniref:AAA family ATPase n=1 Tax=Variovorax paradoxus TaxID=34073 RepID=UPI0009BBAD16|nr:AAA family ATPase [Variovorax paradoxus]
MENPTIACVEIDGLHDQFNVRLQFNPRLNVLYGKNGRGKTTLLHVLANVLELDFERFAHLNFRRIQVTTHAGQTVEIHKIGSDPATILTLNGQVIGGGGSAPDLDASAKATLRAALGGRPVYLPAFRAILERVRAESFADSGRELGYERIRLEERQALKEVSTDRRVLGIYGPSRSDPTAMTARKTMQCREWFGPFVPVIRYPSILEVTDRLSTEHRDAMLETGMQERRMLSEMFVEVFKALLSNEEVPTESEVDTLMQSVQSALETEEKSEEYEFYTDRIGSRLAQELGLVKLRGTHQGGDAERRVLKLYAQMLERRNMERKSAFFRVRQFETAVNKFLDNKVLRVSEDNRASSSGGVFVQTAEQRKYPLSSLSSGERQVLTMLFSATRMATATGIFLIDEPELSLHIDWQRIILSELMAQAQDRQIIACTHSPEVGADHREALQRFSPTPFQRMLPDQAQDTGFSSLDDTL